MRKASEMVLCIRVNRRESLEACQNSYLGVCVRIGVFVFECRKAGRQAAERERERERERWSNSLVTGEAKENRCAPLPANEHTWVHTKIRNK